MRCGWAFGACLALLAGSALGADTGGAPSVDPAKLAALTAEGYAILASAGAQDLFVNQTGQGGNATLIALRHKASGFVCLFSPGAPNGIKVYSAPVRGEDVACRSAFSGGGYSQFLFKRPGQTNAQLLATSESEVQRDYPGAKTGSVETFAATADAPEHLSETLRSDSATNRISIGQVGDWVLEYWSNTPSSGANLGFTDALWGSTVGEHARFLASPAGKQFVAAPQGISPEAARALADAVILKAKADDIFENATAGAIPALRHKPSGFVCDLDTISADSNGIVFFPGPKRGDDVSCTTHPLGSAIDTFVTRRSGNLNQIASSAMSAIKAVHPDMQPFQGQVVGIKPPEGKAATPRLTQRVTYMMGATKLVSRLSVAIVNGWTIEQRMDWRYDEARNLAMDLLGEALINTEVERFAAQPPPAQPSPARVTS